MFIRKAFITNSSSTAFVAYGMVYYADETDNSDWKKILEIALKSFPQDEQDNLGENWSLDELDLRETIEGVYKKAFGEKHPESMKTYEYGGQTWSSPTVPLGFYVEDEYSDPYLMVDYTGIGATAEHYAPQEFDPKKVSEPKMIEALKEFCELTGIPFKEPKWYVVGMVM
jgi:hypothetical protein